MTETALDLSGLLCPLPALKTRKALRGMNPGDRLKVRSTDPLSEIDIPNLLRETGDVLVQIQKTGCSVNFTIEKRSPPETQ